MNEDLELLERWSAGDQGAARTIIEQHYEAVLTFFYRRLRPEEAADLTQATFETLCTKRAAFERRASLRSYIFGIARWKLADHRRLYENRAGMRVPFEAALQEGVDAPSPSSCLFRRRRENLLVQALRSLPLDDQILLELKEYESMTAAELAEVFEIPPGTVASRLRRARQRLTEATERLATSPEDVAETLTNLEEYMQSIRRETVRGVRAGGD